MNMLNNLVKTKDEIVLMRKAAGIIDDVFDVVLTEIKEGVTEIEIAESIRSRVLALGAEGISFDTIVAFGDGGAEPHHVPTEKCLEKGMLITIDMGAVCGGYCSDFTRTVAFGQPSDQQKLIYDIVREAYKKAFAAAVPDAHCKSVDGIARDHIAECGYGEFYVHGTGHGVGIQIHEPPLLNSKSDEILLEGEVVTIEPGIYLPRQMGVRIEDMVLVGEGKPFSRHGTHLIII